MTIPIWVVDPTGNNNPFLKIIPASFAFVVGRSLDDTSDFVSSGESSSDGQSWSAWAPPGIIFALDQQWTMQSGAGGRASFVADMGSGGLWYSTNQTSFTNVYAGHSSAGVITALGQFFAWTGSPQFTGSITNANLSSSSNGTNWSDISGTSIPDTIPGNNDQRFLRTWLTFANGMVWIAELKYGGTPFAFQPSVRVNSFRLWSSSDGVTFSAVTGFFNPTPGIVLPLGLVFVPDPLNKYVLYYSVFFPTDASNDTTQFYIATSSDGITWSEAQLSGAGGTSTAGGLGGPVQSAVYPDNYGPVVASVTGGYNICVIAPLMQGALGNITRAFVSADGTSYSADTLISAAGNSTSSPLAVRALGDTIAILALNQTNPRFAPANGGSNVYSYHTYYSKDGGAITEVSSGVANATETFGPHGESLSVQAPMLILG